MLTFLPGPVLGILSSLLVTVSTVLHVGLLLAVAIVKFIIPIRIWRQLCSRFLTAIAYDWVACNNLFMKITTRAKWSIDGLEGLDPKGWYLVISNHQSNLDIVVLQKILHARIPFLKFFIKSQLIWVPLLGLAWWALDFPFMKRYSKEFLKRHPHLQGKDLEATKKACEKFKLDPISIVNFIEGTRFTPEKAKRQNSPFKHLLKTKAGGLGYVMSAMGMRLNKVVDVTIVYPQGKNSLWDFFCNRVNEINVSVRVIPLEESLIGNYVDDEKYRSYFQGWLNNLWKEKDIKIEKMQQESGAR